MPGRPLEVIQCDADMVDIWTSTLVDSYASAESLSWMSTVYRKGRNGMVAGVH